MMLEQLKYQNHINEVFEFGKAGIYVDTNDLHDYEWAVTKKNNRISALDYSVSKRKLPIVIICETEAEGIKARNRLMEITEKDVLAMKHGRIIIGDYYFRCFVTKSQKKDYLKSKRHMAATLTLTTDFPFWVKETTTSFRAGGTDTSGGKNLDFAHDYPFDFAGDVESSELNNTGFADANFRMIIYGACHNPEVYINGHRYKVFEDAAEGEYITIDSVAKTVTRTDKNGGITNLFNARDRDSYIFEKIPPGISSVSWSGDFGVDIITLEERSEPKWI